MTAMTTSASIALPHYNVPGYVRMKGPAMRPTIAPGEWVMIYPNVTSFDGEGIYLTAFDGPRPVPQLKRLRYSDGVLMVVSDDPMYEPFPAGDNLLIGGKMIGKV
jgi:phage repressor protein C with HTH and peptisase S24 domain